MDGMDFSMDHTVMDKNAFNLEISNFRSPKPKISE